MAISLPAVGDQGTASWAGSVASAINGPMLGEATSVGSITLTTAATAVAGLAAVTFTLAVQTRVRIDSMTQYLMASGTNGRYSTRSVYNTGSSAVIGSAVTV